MGLELDGSDVLAMAQWIEQQAGGFYDNLAGKVDDQITRKMLGDLAAMERDHEHVFHALRDAHLATVGAAGLPYAHILMQLCVDVRSTLTESFTGRESPAAAGRSAYFVQFGSLSPEIRQLNHEWTRINTNIKHFRGLAGITRWVNSAHYGSPP